MTSTLDIIEETHRRRPPPIPSDTGQSRLAPTNSTSREGSNLELGATTGAELEIDANLAGRGA
jgi:hypothetical protein